MTSTSSLTSLLRHAAPRLSQHFFVCRQCLHNKPPSATQIRLQTTGRNVYRSKRQTPFLQAFRRQSTIAPTSIGSSSLGRLREAVQSDGQSSTRSKSFPDTSAKLVAYWLLGSAASVYGMVVLGGLTRLTESGLSITEWRPVTGTLPPLSTYNWRMEYDKYRASPEFQKLNPNMTLEEFKKIYYMEYAHRLWGRVIGLTFLIPTVYFIAKRRVSKTMARNLILINGLIVTQGFVGWWMVKSGLKDDLFATGAHPRVSQYRLATHLGLAFTVYTAMLWNGLQIFKERHLVLGSQPNRAVQFLARLGSPSLRPFRLFSMFTAALIGTTALSGALVAGLDAGLIYNEFPYMGNGLTPPSSELWSPFYSRLPAPHPDLWWRNMLENPSLVQLDHRILAVSTFTSVHALYAYAWLSPTVSRILTRGCWQAMHGVFGLVWVQVTLGLGTLLYMVPTSLAAAHQAGAMALMSGAVLLGSRLWTTPRLLRMVRGRMELVSQTMQRRRQAQHAGKRGKLF